MIEDWLGGRPVRVMVRTSGGTLSANLGLSPNAKAEARRDGLSLRAVARRLPEGAFAIDAALRNDTGQPVTVQSISPAVISARLGHPALTLANRVFRQGWQSWSPALSIGLSQYDVPSRPPVEAPVESAHTPGRTGVARSDEVAVLGDPASGRSLLVGFSTAHRFVTQVLVDRARGDVEAVCYADGVSVPPGGELRAERLIVDAAGDANEQLERYALRLATDMGVRRGGPPRRAPSGWCSWYYYFTNVSEQDILDNLRFLQDHRRQLPVEWVQIDDGYQADIGDWLAVNRKFPRGMGWLASEIKRAGFRPGIWLAPFIVSERSGLFREHPDWVVRDENGEPALAIHNWGQRNFGLDGSRPEAVAWTRDLFREMVEGWGYDYVKIDFLFGAAIAGRRHDPDVARVEAYRRLLQAVREEVGPKRFILGCGALMGASAGVVDGMRIGPDVAPWWQFQPREEREGQAKAPRRHRSRVLARAEPATDAAIRNTMTRAWMHERLWANDPDCLLVRADRTKLTLDEVHTLATVIALSGGMTLSSDNLTTVPPERLDLVSMSLPPLPVSVRARDLMERPSPLLFEAFPRGRHAPARLIAVVNWDDRPRDMAVDLPWGEWTVFELWTERLCAAQAGRVRLPRVPAHGCRLLAVRPAAGRPQFAGSTLHLGQGTLDLAGEEWDGRTLVLRLRATARERGEVFVAAPSGLRAVRARSGRSRAAVRQSGGLVRVAVDGSRGRTLRVTFG